MDHTKCCTCKAIFPRDLLNVIWKNDIRNTKF